VTPRPAILIRRPDVLECLLPDDPGLTRSILKVVAPDNRKTSRLERVRVWRIDPSEYAVITGALRVYDIPAEVYSPPNASQVRPAAAARSLSDRDVLGVTEAAPWPVVESAYRAMAMLYHPDRAGYQETERMKRINLAYGRLQEANRV